MNLLLPLSVRGFYALSLFLSVSGISSESFFCTLFSSSPAGSHSWTSGEQHFHQACLYYFSKEHLVCLNIVLVIYSRFYWGLQSRATIVIRRKTVEHVSSFQCQKASEIHVDMLRERWSQSSYSVFTPDSDTGISLRVARKYCSCTYMERNKMLIMY